MMPQMAVVLLFASLAAAPAPQLPAAMPAADAERQLQTLMEQYYRAYAKEDLAAMEAIWHPQGPARFARNILEVEFELGDTEFQSLRLSDVVVDAGGARARAVVDLRSTRGTYSRIERRVRDLTFLPEGGTWRLWNEASAGRTLATRVLSIPADEIDRVLAAEPELASDDVLAGLATEAMWQRTRGQASDMMRVTDLRLRLARAIGHEAVAANCLTEIGLQHQVARPLLSPASRLFIVPDGFLWGVPFEALRSPAGHYLVEDAAVSYLPSLWSERLYREATALAKTPRLLAVASPIVSPIVGERIALARPGAPALEPAAGAIEARSVRTLLGTAGSVLLAANATPERVVAGVPEGGILHVAAPALLNDASPFHSSVVLSPSGPADAAGGLADASSVMSWSLPAGLVMLSRAEPIQPRPTGEALTALSWAFLAAGAPTLAPSRWSPVETASRTDPLVRAFYRELLRPVQTEVARPLAAEVLQRAARRLLAVPATRHPWYWARLMVIGR